MDREKIMRFVGGIEVPANIECRVVDGDMVFERQWSPEYLGMVNRVSCDGMDPYTVVHGENDTIENFREGLRRYLTHI